jgi:glycosyltransferase involved in cell wall biosynthesis
LKVLFVNPNAVLGGAERVLLGVIGSLRQAHANWTLELLMLDDGMLSAVARQLNISAAILTMPKSLQLLGDSASGGPAGDHVSKYQLAERVLFSLPQLAFYVAKLRKLIAAHAPDVIHSNGLKAHLLAVWAAPGVIPIVWHIHDYVSSRPLVSHLMRMRATRCAIAIANSQSVAADLQNWFGKSLKIATVYNGLDLAHFSPEGPKLDLDAICGFAPRPREVVRVGLIATGARWKGHDVFLRAISMLPEQPIRAFIIGGPIYKTEGSQYTLAELRAIACKLGIAHRIGFTGFVDDTAPAIRALDIVVHASTRPEPFGLVVAEGMACGKPIVVARVGGVAEIIRENENSMSHEAGDAAGMADCIKRLGADPELRRTLGAQARRWAERRFDRERLARELTPIYQSITRAV